MMLNFSFTFSINLIAQHVIGMTHFDLAVHSRKLNRTRLLGTMEHCHLQSNSLLFDFLAAKKRIKVKQTYI